MRNRGQLFLFLIAGILVLNATSLSAQESRITISNYLTDNLERLGLVESDLQKWEINDEFLTKHNGVTHVNIQQSYNGIDVFNGVSTFALDAEGRVIHDGSNLTGNLSAKANTTTFQLGEQRAIENGMTYMDLQSREVGEFYVKKAYFPTESELRLSWHLELHTIDRQHVWHIIVDGVNGAILEHWDQVIHCPLDTYVQPSDNQRIRPVVQTQNIDERRVGASYNVFALPVESPNHGGRNLLVSPEDSSASPFGWHDNNGQDGADFTITRGNNVYAYEDADANNSPGYSPDGGEDLNFNFEYQDDVAPIDNQDAALTNLFYMNNAMHDIWHGYGFDEPSGNFQANNYGNGCCGGDAVLAQGFDGANLNNATFSTPGDGQNPRMSMFLWNNSGIQEYLTINAPAAIEGPYTTTTSTFGPSIPATPLTADVALFEDATAPVNDACEPAVNGVELNGKIALIDRGDCDFILKVEAAQDEGAVAVIMVNNVLGPPVTMSASLNINILIPSVMVSKGDGDLIKAQLSNNETVNATLVDPSAGTNLIDGELDNGIIAHEYGHGISSRLVGGRLNTNCLLFNDEQMGEGWSDWFGLMVTMDLSADNPIRRPIGTYVTREGVDGFGIRPAPYDTSFTENPYTYGNLGDDDISIPHGVGFVWSTMLWDLTWAFIDEYGFDADIGHGSGGNNMVMQLVIDGLKMTNCGPGFVNGRDAILAADNANNNGENQCLIWKAFARRGLGFSASQGSANNVNDGTEAFDLPPACLATTGEVIADFVVDQTISCDGEIAFSDESLGDPISWLWDFGDGSTSEEQNPVHQYTTAGTYTITMTATNDTDMDEITITDLITIVFVETPTGTSDASICSGETATLTATSPNTLQWYDAASNVLANGSPFTTAVLTETTTFQVSDIFIIEDATCESDKVDVVVEVLTADFSSTEDDLTVSFEDLSDNATSWSWDFGDGNTSNEQNPAHIYESGGTYTVMLTIDGLCSSEAMVDVVSTGITEPVCYGRIDSHT